MSKKDNGSDGLNRRNMLRKSAAGATGGLLGLSQATVTWAKPTESEIEQLESEPSVQAVLNKINRSELPSDTEKVSGTLGKGEGESKIEFWEGSVEYGTLTVGKVSNHINVIFSFDYDSISEAPEQFRSIPAGTDPIVTALGDRAIVKRSTTDREEQAIRATLPVTGSEMISYTTSLSRGFLAEVFTNIEGDDELNRRRFMIRTTNAGTHPVYQESSGAIVEADPAIQAEGIIDDVADLIEDGVNTDAVEGIKGSLGVKPWKQIPDSAKKIENLGKSGVKSVVAASIPMALDSAGAHCGADCADCAISIKTLATDCTKCRIFLTTSVSAIGAVSAVLLIVCMWNFCNVPRAINKCDKCLDCATEKV
ncbi:hypothetical protein [Halorussus sp. MSC15.2]|uniref:hypothetical protein n=1 Tax=Halorussus sp. MSC15.2 TaxID=2283638 RepID=UPI0013D58380|nr:hypothetical protein [Halorussus sp. MSC15.2]NEU56016.1 hypothetical protein [Halorussus sp. MSC15.2]